MVVEVDVADTVFILEDDNFDFCDFFGWVKYVTFFEVKWSCLASLTITKSEPKYEDIKPLNLCESKTFKFKQALVDQIAHIWKN